MGKEKFKKAEKSEKIYFFPYRTEKIHRELLLVLCTTLQFQKHNKIIWKSRFAFKTCHLNKCTTTCKKTKLEYQQKKIALPRPNENTCNFFFLQLCKNGTWKEPDLWINSQKNIWIAGKVNQPFLYIIYSSLHFSTFEKEREKVVLQYSTYIFEKFDLTMIEGNL